jgi:hypothetical protein
MIKIQSSFMDWRFGRIGRSGAIVLLCLFTIIGFAVVVAQLATPRGEVQAAPSAGGSQPRLEINRLENKVAEGDDFRLIVNEKFDEE